MDGANWYHVLLLEKARFFNVGLLRNSSKVQRWGRIEAMHRSIYKNKKMNKKRIRKACSTLQRLCCLCPTFASRYRRQIKVEQSWFRHNMYAAEHPWSRCTKQAPKLFSQFVGWGEEGFLCVLTKVSRLEFKLQEHWAAAYRGKRKTTWRGTLWTSSFSCICDLIVVYVKKLLQNHHHPTKLATLLMMWREKSRRMCLRLPSCHHHQEEEFFISSGLEAPVNIHHQAQQWWTVVVTTY